MVEKTDHALFFFVYKVELINGPMKGTWHLEEDHPNAFKHQSTCLDILNERLEMQK